MKFIVTVNFNYNFYIYIPYISKKIFKIADVESKRKYIFYIF